LKKKLLTEFDREILIDRINQVGKAFTKDDELFNKVMNKRVPLSHFLVIDRIHRRNFNSLKDIELIMFCGVFDSTFSAGDYGYNQTQCISINKLNDFIFSLKNMEYNERKKWIKEGN